MKDDTNVINKFNQFYSEFDNSKETLVAFIRDLIQVDFLENVNDLGNLYEDVAEDFIRIDREGITSALLS